MLRGSSAELDGGGFVECGAPAFEVGDAFGAERLGRRGDRGCLFRGPLVGQRGPDHAAGVADERHRRFVLAEIAQDVCGDAERNRGRTRVADVMGSLGGVEGGVQRGVVFSSLVADDRRLGENDAHRLLVVDRSRDLYGFVEHREGVLGVARAVTLVQLTSEDREGERQQTGRAQLAGGLDRRFDAADVADDETA